VENPWTLFDGCSHASASDPGVEGSAAFIAAPGLAVYSAKPTHFERLDGPVDGPMLIAAAATVLGHRSDAYVWVLERARVAASGLNITELCP
jgi:hypothetical protein